MDHQDADATTSHSFIVKVWLERTRSAVQGPTWRGRIIHVPSGEQQYVQELDGIALFIALRLAELGVRFSPLWRLRGWQLAQRQRHRSSRTVPKAAGSSSDTLEEDSPWP